MSAHEPQVVDSNEFIGLLDYQFSGDTYTVERKRAFISFYREKGSIYHAARAVPVSRKTVYNWLEVDEQFAQAVADSKEDTVDTIEASVYERAFKSDLLAMFYLKAHRPQYRDRLQVNVDELREQVRERLQAINTLQITSESESKQKED